MPSDRRERLALKYARRGAGARVQFRVIRRVAFRATTAILFSLFNHCRTFLRFFFLRVLAGVVEMPHIEAATIHPTAQSNG